jgi:hypothetical protein
VLVVDLQPALHQEVDDRMVHGHAPARLRLELVEVPLLRDRRLPCFEGLFDAVRESESLVVAHLAVEFALQLLDLLRALLAVAVALLDGQGVVGDRLPTLLDLVDARADVRSLLPDQLVQGAVPAHAELRVFHRLTADRVVGELLVLLVELTVLEQQVQAAADRDHLAQARVYPEDEGPLLQHSVLLLLQSCSDRGITITATATAANFTADLLVKFQERFLSGDGCLLVAAFYQHCLLWSHLLRVVDVVLPVAEVHRAAVDLHAVDAHDPVLDGPLRDHLVLQEQCTEYVLAERLARALNFVAELFIEVVNRLRDSRRSQVIRLDCNCAVSTADGVEDVLKPVVEVGEAFVVVVELVREQAVELHWVLARLAAVPVELARDDLHVEESLQELVINIYSFFFLIPLLLLLFKSSSSSISWISFLRLLWAHELVVDEEVVDRRDISELQRDIQDVSLDRLLQLSEGLHFFHLPLRCRAAQHLEAEGHEEVARQLNLAAANLRVQVS